MNATLAAILLDLLGAYLALGAAFAVAFVVAGVDRVDPGAAGGTVGFRLLILPGAAALWPLLARRWWAARGEVPEQHDAHTDATRAARDLHEAAARRPGAVA